MAPSPIWTDLTTFPSQRFRNKIHGIIGGYPCQPFSVAGKGAGTSDPRHIWPYIKEIINTINPVWCFFENVRNHVNIGFEQVREDLQAMDYTVNAGIFSAEEVGAPHRRERLFIFAIRTDVVNAISSGLQGNNRRGASAKSQDGYPMANAMRQGLERQRGGSQQSCAEQTFPIYRDDRWPAGRDEEQFEWEAPRVKSSLGFTVNGYNFREDLLRMAGNGVVEQTAELAFITLLKKFSL